MGATPLDTAVARLNMMARLLSDAPRLTIGEETYLLISEASIQYWVVLFQNSVLYAAKEAIRQATTEERDADLSPREQELEREMEADGYTDPPADEDMSAIMEGGHHFTKEQVRHMSEEGE